MELLILLLVIVFIIIATIKFKMHPVISLTIAALASGFLLGLAPDVLIETIGQGFGKTLSSIGLVIAFGTVIGIFLEKTGATTVLATTILSFIGVKRSPLALNLAGFVVSIPVFCDSGFIVLSSLNKRLSLKTGIPKLVFAIALATGLYSAHVFVPPTPGPLAAAAILEADLGLVMLFGLAVAIPVSVTGYLWAIFMGVKAKSENLEEESILKEVIAEEKEIDLSPISAFLPLLVPVVLIAFKSLAEYPTHFLGQGLLFKTLIFIGNPIVALLIGVFFAFFLARKTDSKVKNGWVVDALKQAGQIVLITGAGGAFGAILRTVDITSFINLSATSQTGGLLLCFGIASVLKTAQGSSTVSIITTAAIVAPLLSSFGLEAITEKALAVLAVGAGAMTFSHINDSYFWVVSQFSNLPLKTALKTHSIATLLQGITGILLIILLNLLF